MVKVRDQPHLDRASRCLSTQRVSLNASPTSVKLTWSYDTERCPSQDESLSPLDLLDERRWFRKRPCARYLGHLVARGAGSCRRHRCSSCNSAGMGGGERARGSETVWRRCRGRTGPSRRGRRRCDRCWCYSRPRGCSVGRGGRDAARGGGGARQRPGMHANSSLLVSLRDSKQGEGDNEWSHNLADVVVVVVDGGRGGSHTTVRVPSPRNELSVAQARSHGTGTWTAREKFWPE